MVLIAQKFLDDQVTNVTVQDIAMLSHNAQICLEDYASDILRCHYGTLSQSLQYPIRVAQLLCGERVISKTTFSIMKSTAQSFFEDKPAILLLKAVRHAVHTDYHNLEVFASVLLKFTNNVVLLLS